MTPDAYINHVKSQCRNLTTFGLLPTPPEFNPDAWLRNFDRDDRVVAAILLQQFTLIGDDAIIQLLRRAFLKLLQQVAPSEADTAARRSQIED